MGIAKRVRILTLPDLPEKGDISNWIEAGGTAEQLWALVEQAQECRAPSTEQRPKNSKTKPASEDDPPHWHVEPWPEPVSGAELLDGDLRRPGPLHGVAQACGRGDGSVGSARLDHRCVRDFAAAHRRVADQAVRQDHAADHPITG